MSETTSEHLTITRDTAAQYYYCVVLSVDQLDEAIEIAYECIHRDVDLTVHVNGIGTIIFRVPSSDVKKLPQDNSDPDPENHPTDALLEGHYLGNDDSGYRLVSLSNATLKRFGVDNEKVWLTAKSFIARYE